MSGGFRAVVREMLPEQGRDRTMLHLLLDDLPGAALVSGHAVSAGGVRPSLRRADMLGRADVCAGWRTDATMLVEFGRTGSIPTVTGPAAPVLERDDDPWAWHACDALPAHAMRRRRRLDLVSGDPLEVDVLFRDSHMDPEGRESVLHEYTVTGRIDPSTLQILQMEAAPRTLPWAECPAAAASAGCVVGETVEGLRRWVRSELTGMQTCTHLNDTLRSLEDVDALDRILAAADDGTRREV